MDKVKIDEFGTKRWYKNGKIHKEDGHAVENTNGAKEWWKNGKLHREDGPAIEYDDGSKEWIKGNLYHRENGPAIECANGDKFWYKEGKCHRENGPAIEYASGTKFWCINNILIYEHINKNNILDKIYEKTFNKIFINVEKENIIYLRNKFNLIDIERFLNE